MNKHTVVSLLVLGVQIFCSCRKNAPIGPESPPKIEMSDVIFSRVDGWIYTMESDGSNRSKVVEGYLPKWSPKWDKIALFQMFNNQTEEWLAIFDPNTGTVRKVAISRPVMVFGSSGCAWRFDGQVIAFNRTAGGLLSSDIYTVNVGDGSLTRLTHGGFNYGPCWSPDGTVLSFTRDPNPGDSLVAGYYVNADGSNLREVRYDGSAWCSAVRWSPDGKMVAFSGKPDSSLRFTPWIDLYVADFAGTTARRLTRDGISGVPIWAPNGQDLLFLKIEHETVDMYVMNMDGSNLRALTKHGRVYYESSMLPLWSSNGRRITYWYYNSDTMPTLRFINSDGTGDFDTQVSSHLGYDWRRE